MQRKKGYLDSFGIYGWEKVENLLLTGLVSELPLLLVGHKGTSKTQAVDRLFQGIDAARRQRGL